MIETARPADLFRRCRVTTVESGLESALELLSSELGPEHAVGHGGRVLLPEPMLRHFPEARTAGRHPTDAEGLVLAETDREAGHRLWRVGVAWIRVGAVERLNRRATDRLARRRVRNNATLALPLVRVSVGDIAACLAAAVALLEDGFTAETLPSALVESDIGQALRATWKLFGASGYVVDTPSNLAQAVTLLGEVYSIDTGEAT